MATRLATARNFITVTTVPQNDNNDGCKTEIMESHSENNSASDVQCTTQITPVALHHVNLSQVRQLWIVDSFRPFFLTPNNSTIRQKKIILQTGSNGGVSVIDVVPLESSDSSDSQILVAESLASNGQNENGQQVTAQGKRNFWLELNFLSQLMIEFCPCLISPVAVVQGSPGGGQQHFITVSGKLRECCDFSCLNFAFIYCVIPQHSSPFYFPSFIPHCLQFVITLNP